MRDALILPAVFQDIADAAAWYDEEGYQGLGDRFIDAFYASLSRIQKDGEIYRTAYKDFRRILIRPFPYSIFYRLHTEKWIIALVIHAARNPSLARKLLRKRKAV